MDDETLVTPAEAAPETPDISDAGSIGEMISRVDAARTAEPEAPPVPLPEPLKLDEKEPVAEAAPAEPVPVDPAMAELRLQLQEKDRLLAGYQAAPTQPAPVQADPMAELAQRCQINLPPDLVQGLRSEDPATYQAALNGMVQMSVMHGYQLMQQELWERFAPQVQNAIQTAHQNTARRDHVAEDFYGKYPDLNQPNLRNLVRSTAEAVYRETGARDWSEAVRDIIAHRVYSTVNAIPKQEPAPAEPAPFVSGGSPARRPLSPTDPNSPRGIADALLGPD